MAMSERPEALSFRPLYRQVREALIGRLIDGSWAPGAMLPSEFQIAAELGVSQGTVRKALDAMAAEHLLVRRQGRGTFVALPEDGRILFKFFRLAADDGTTLFPESVVIDRVCGPASPADALPLRIPTGTPVWRIARNRRLGGRVVITEQIVLPVGKFPRLAEIHVLPNNVYALYSEKFSITIGQAAEKLKAAVADERIATELRCLVGQPILAIERVALALDGTPVEWRVSYCRTDGFHYRSDLR